MSNDVLVDLIKEYPPTDSDQVVFNKLSAKEVEIKDETLYTFKYLVSLYGVDFTNSVLSKLESAATNSPVLRSTLTALNTVGLDFSDSISQAMIQSLVKPGGFTQQEVDKLKSVGVQLLSKLDVAGIPFTTLEEVTEIRAQDYRLTTAEKFRWFYNNHVADVETQQLTRQQLLEIATQLFGD